MMQTRLVPLKDMAVIMTEPWVDQSRRPFIAPEGAYIPVREGFPSTHILPSRKRSGRGYQKLGDVVIFHGTHPTRDEVNEVKILENPRGIFWLSGHMGVTRKPQIIRIEGSGGEVTHRESGIIYRLDIEQVMFSQGNREEKSRISKMIHPGETVADMFAGIGYFSLGMAKAGALIHAMEINPVSFKFLKLNSTLNGLAEKIKAENGDCRNLLSGEYDRIHMGHFEAVAFLNHALNHCHKKTILHIHMLGDRSDDIKKIIKESSLKANISLHKVKKAGPRTWHMVADVVIE